MEHTEIVIAGENLQLFPDRSLLWKSESVLVISDLHLGKAMHFRKSGIQIPAHVILSDLERLGATIREKAVKKVIFLGDLFHSVHNVEWEIFCEFAQSELKCYELMLVAGNHDVLSYWDYDRAGLMVCKKPLAYGPFIFAHHPADKVNTGYRICGHIHPGVSLRGNARQSLKLPCFFFGDHQGVMPAYGSLTGMKVLRPRKDDQVYVITANAVIRV
jgi:DNA ligase-associated metallophosphoesterase